MLSPSCVCSSFFFFNDTATTEIYTLSLHDALPILLKPYGVSIASDMVYDLASNVQVGIPAQFGQVRSEEHTSELQSRLHLVCRLLLEKKKPQRFVRRGMLTPK